MKFPKRKHPRLKEYDYSNDGGYFVTVCVKNKEKLLGEPVLVNGKIKLTPIGETAEKHIKAINSAYDGVRVDSYMIMPDHIHMLITISGGMRACRPTSLQTVVRTFKTMVTREIGFSVWQTSFYEHIVRDEKDYTDIDNYIKANPQKYAR
ncbi:MAG: transposase [Oscillospiraceae bacterium]|jgi:putative transposase|nr:transposase [Oscillospiraceae bacterium]